MLRLWRVVGELVLTSAALLAVGAVGRLGDGVQTKNRARAGARGVALRSALAPRRPHGLADGVGGKGEADLSHELAEDANDAAPVGVLEHGTVHDAVAADHAAALGDVDVAHPNDHDVDAFVTEHGGHLRGVGRVGGAAVGDDKHRLGDVLAAVREDGLADEVEAVTSVGHAVAGLGLLHLLELLEGQASAAGRAVEEGNNRAHWRRKGGDGEPDVAVVQVERADDLLQEGDESRPLLLFDASRLVNDEGKVHLAPATLGEVAACREMGASVSGVAYLRASSRWSGGR
ncbi:polysaccharide deacetylase [Babesia caballi]|uniref:Polysaccharide deacetylase n=1 Tax=Babesia caballi TaxID=5871 RepID=A0AAV4LWL5_BABCB|nr:polysaccharide deacetylase [Babesia caballi]